MKAHIDCDELPSIIIGNETKWGCQASVSRIDCREQNDWSKHCCTWKEEKCVWKHNGII